MLSVIIAWRLLHYITVCFNAGYVVGRVTCLWGHSIWIMGHSTTRRPRGDATTLLCRGNVTCSFNFGITIEVYGGTGVTFGMVLVHSGFNVFRCMMIIDQVIYIQKNILDKKVRAKPLQRTCSFPFYPCTVYTVQATYIKRLKGLSHLNIRFVLRDSLVRWPASQNLLIWVGNDTQC